MIKERHSPEVELLCQLVARRSVTPEDAGCQQLLRSRLEAIGFACETLQFGEVTNLWARRGSTGPVFCFAGHTDVVPPGDLAQWQSDPFEPFFTGDFLYGRGSADMKAGLAAMTVALERFLQTHPQPKGSLAMLITSDEEGRARDGTLKVIETLQQRDERIDWCVLGEPSSEKTLGDVVRIGRRGSMSCLINVNGVQGHVAYPQLADNPIRRFAPLLDELHRTEWDKGNRYFPPTSFQFVDIQSGSGAPNVTPATLSARFNFRYSTEWTFESLKARVEEMFQTHEMDVELNWHLSGEPFLTRPGGLIDAVSESVRSQTGAAPELSTGGGTSDGRFISPAGADVVELGPVSASIHKVNEHVRVADVSRLTDMYEQILERLMG